MAAPVMSVTFVPRIASTATGSCEVNQPRLPMPLRAAPEAPGCPSSALYIALLPRRFMTTTAASAAAGSATRIMYQRQKPPTTNPIPAITTNVATAASSMNHPILGSMLLIA